MGNCPACLSISKPLHFSIADHHTDNADPLSRSAASRALHACYAHQPVLKPCIQSTTTDQLKGKLYQSKEGAQKLITPACSAANQKTAGAHLKPMKKVRFAEEIMLISAFDRQKEFPLAEGGKFNKELSHKNKPSSPRSILIGQSSNIEVKQSKLVRVKVVVTKKELGALLQAREKKNGSLDALMLESVLSPLLMDCGTLQSSTHKTPPTFHVQQNANSIWRPLLEHIQEHP